MAATPRLRFSRHALLRLDKNLPISSKLRKRLWFFHILCPPQAPTIKPSTSNFKIPVRITHRQHVLAHRKPLLEPPRPRFLTPLPRVPRHQIRQRCPLQFGLLNVRSLNHKVDDILDLQRCLSLDLLFLVETWHDENSVCIGRLRQTGLQVNDQPRPRSVPASLSTNHGGVAIISSTRVHQSRLNIHDFHIQSFEMVCSRIMCGTKSLLAILIYRTGPISSIFFDELSQILEVYAVCEQHIILAGDLNIRIERSDDTNTQKLLQVTATYGLSYNVSSSTHKLGGTLDAVFSRCDLPPINVAISDPQLSDHFLLSWQLPICSSPPIYHTRTYRPWNRLDLDHFRHAISYSSLCSPDAWRELDSDLLATLFDSALTSILDQLIPLKRVTLRHRPSDLWFDGDCRMAKRAGRRFERSYRRLISSTVVPDVSLLSNALLAWRASYRSYRALLRAKRKSYWSSRLNPDRSSPRDLWNSINFLMGRGAARDSPLITADALHQHFDSKVSHARALTENSPPPAFTQVPRGSNFSAFNEVSEVTVISLFRRLPNKSSHDPLRTSLLKDCIDLLAPIITRIFNTSLSSGVFPRVWKEAHVRPILKRGKKDSDDLTSYRPISNLRVLSKALEKLVAFQLRSYLERNHLFPVLQSAYRPFHSTETAILKVTSDILCSIDKGNVSLLCSLDLSSAFDCIDHEILLNRLEISFGLEGAVIKWFRSFLSDRVQCVLYGGSSSNFDRVPCGVPQGSVLGPLLFILYITDIFHIVDSFKLSIHMFADDIQLYGCCLPSKSNELSSKMSLCLDEIITWLSSNRLLVNASKSECMWCSSRPARRNLSQNVVRFGNCNVSPVSSVKFLGVHLDFDLTFSTHVTKTVSSCIQTLRQIRSIRRSISCKLAISLINALVLPRIDYSLPALHGVHDKTTKRLQSVLHASARLIFKSSRFARITPLLRRLRWLPIKARIDYRLLLLAHKCLQGNAPAYLAKELTPVRTLPGRSRLRSSNSDTLSVPSVRRPTIGGRAFAATATRAWNQLPPDLQSVSCTKSFKNLLKRHFLDRCF